MNQDREPTLPSHRQHPFRVIPVIDLLDGQAVHAIGGQRAHYRPIQSVLHPAAEPVALARALSNALALDLIYLADIDAISGRPPAVEAYKEIISANIHIWLDCGVRDLGSLAHLHDLDPTSHTIVVGLETINGPRALTEIVNDAGQGRVIFSLDLFDGRPRIPATADWSTQDPRELARMASDCGARHLLILDLARVGSSRGPGTRRLMEDILAGTPSVLLSLGGGLSCVEEIAALREGGANAVLVGSAIHDGRIGVHELARLENRHEQGQTREALEDRAPSSRSPANRVDRP